MYGGGFTPYSIFDIRYSFIRNAQQSGIQVREGARTNIVGHPPNARALERRRPEGTRSPPLATGRGMM